MFLVFYQNFKNETKHSADKVLNFQYLLFLFYFALMLISTHIYFQNIKYVPCIYIRRKEIFFIFFFTMCTNHYTNSTLRLNGILGESQILNFLYDYLVIRTMTNEYFIKLPKFPLEGIINMCFLDKCGQPYVNDRHM